MVSVVAPSLGFRLGSIGIVIALTLGACARERESEHDGEHLARSHQELISAAQHYIGVGSCAPKQLALTFDDGPGWRTAELSTYLKEQGIRAVFFVNGACIQPTTLPNNACKSPPPGAVEALAQLTADGHLVANHTTTHRDITTVPQNQLVQELAETDALIASYAKPPYNRLLFRAPYGAWNSAVASTLQSSAMSGYVGPIFWDIGNYSDRYPNAAADWACWQGSLKDTSGALVHSAPGDTIPDGYATTQECGDAYLNEIKSVGRGILLMHEPYGWDQGSTVDMVKYMVPILKSAGYTFVRADEISVIAADLPPCAVDGCGSCSGPGPNQCTACVAGRYLSNGACVLCTTCDENSYAATACGVTTDAQCAACSTCGSGHYVAAACTAMTNTVCSPCHPSCKECRGPGAGDCAACPPGQYSSENACHDCTKCPHGMRASSPCTATADTVCTAGDLSQDGGSLTLPSSSVAPDAGDRASAKSSGGCAVAAAGPRGGMAGAWLAVAAAASLLRRRRTAPALRS
jgi:peptidoglycan/xylan/chitin deacetylase (PgdA/CDA1 family)